MPFSIKIYWSFGWDMTNSFWEDHKQQSSWSRFLKGTKCVYKKQPDLLWGWCTGGVWNTHLLCIGISSNGKFYQLEYHVSFYRRSYKYTTHISSLFLLWCMWHIFRAVLLCKLIIGHCVGGIIFIISDLCGVLTLFILCVLCLVSVQLQINVIYVGLTF